jgi:uncharacterized protein
MLASPTSRLPVRIAPLPDGLHEETLRPSAESLDLDPAVFADVAVDVRLDVGERRVLAAYTARATARLVCDRTLAPYEHPVEGAHAVLFTADAPADNADDDVAPLPDDATHIDLGAAVHDTLVLALPLRRVSPEAEGAEIETRFGGPAEGEPADDRWAALEALRRSGDDPD